MAAPVVTVSFTASVECGPSPLTVNFTNTTTLDLGTTPAGTQRMWLWEFGDGEISESENPSHTYTGTPGQTYDVTLSVLATDGAAAAISVSSLNPTYVSHTRLYGSGATNNDAWAARSSDPLANSNTSHNLIFNGATYAYETATPTLQLKSASGSLAFILIQTKINPGISSILGTVNIDGFSETPTVVDVWTNTGRLSGVTVSTPKTVTAQVLPEEQLASPTAGQRWGNDATFRTRTYPPNSTQDYGESTESDFISLAAEPVASFTSSPSAGPNPLQVQFTNTGTVGCNTSPTYSWKRRITGSGDAFVEFSTSENPLTSFTKS